VGSVGRSAAQAARPGIMAGELMPVSPARSADPERKERTPPALGDRRFCSLFSSAGSPARFLDPLEVGEGHAHLSGHEEERPVRMRRELASALGREPNAC